MTTVPFNDLKAQYQSIKGEIDEAVGRTLASSAYILGPEVAAFERRFAEYCGATTAIGLNSGTSALHLALLAAGVGRGDEVVTVSFTFVATVAAILYTGARPVLVDIDPVTFTMDPSRLEAAITPKTKAIVPVHLYGHPADMDPILDIARRHGVMVIEDAAQAHGAEYKGRRAGSMGEIGCFSFYPGKNLGAYGEGGAVTTSNPARDRQIRMLRDWGAEKKYQHDMVAYNYRMEGLQGAILAVKLAHLEAWTEARRAHAATYTSLLSGADVGLPAAAAHARHVYHVYAIRHPRRDDLMKRLQECGVSTGIHYPIPVHLQPGYAPALGYRPGDFPHSEKAANEVISLPMFPELTTAQLQHVAEATRMHARG